MEEKNPKGSFLVLSRDSTTVSSESIRRLTAEGSESQSQFLVLSLYADSKVDSKGPEGSQG